MNYQFWKDVLWNAYRIHLICCAGAVAFVTGVAFGFYIVAPVIAKLAA